ncbi:MAG TPA: recombinase family protein [Candidatus Coproplasma avistercoris]|nr:recombinase family protein [Candidatus Coproplasma avistercoris]
MSKLRKLNRTALYMRLSRDDEKAGESMSIENQRAILRKFVSENDGAITDEYIDDGWSGTDFDRPGVKRLLDDAKGGKIDTIVVKDLSRFGRNYIQVGQYIDYIFPAYGIRFIALSDNVDTADRTSAGMDMMPIMNVFNEWHAANTSKKIRAVLEANWRQGRCTNWAYPYGYKAGTDENRTAVIDEPAAKVVRRIYDMRLQGNSACAIARALTDEGIPTPAAYYTRLDGKKANRRSSPWWSPKTVADILKDTTYTGTLTQHRTTRFSYKNHKVLNVPESERIVRENAHEAIIDRQTWDKVQAINNSVSRGRHDKANMVHPLSGLLICPDCGKKLKGKSGGRDRIYMYCCRTYVDLGKRYCTSHSITEKQIESIVLQDIRSMLGRVEIDEERAKEHFFKERAKCGERNRLSDEKRLHSFNDRLAELDKLIQSAFEEKVLGNLPESMCKSLFEKYQVEKESAQRQINMLEEQIAAVNEMDAEVEEYIAQLKRYANCEELTREMCLQLIEFITIGERPSDDTPREIHIYYKFISYQTLAEYRGQTTK